jgi:hypothetical protein
MENDKILSNDVLVCITSFDYIDNADYLKKEFSSFYKTINIHSDNSKNHPKYADIIIPNQYYTGLWNESVRLAIFQEYKWILFIASDIKILSPDTKTICNYIQNIIQDNTIGIYTFSVDKKSRCTFKDLVNFNTNHVRNTSFVEGFCFLCKTLILKDMYPTPIEKNIYGWGLDIIMCKISLEKKLRVVVDDRITIHHPKSKFNIDTKLAKEQSKKYIQNKN